MERSPALPDAYRLSASGYEMDVVPSIPEAAILKHLRDFPDRILRSPTSTGFVFEKAAGGLRTYLVRALINKAWIAPPNRDGPLFGRPSDGTLTLRGSYALRRFETP